jgi:hypothetical protein
VRQIERSIVLSTLKTSGLFVLCFQKKNFTYASKKTFCFYLTNKSSYFRVFKFVSYGAFGGYKMSSEFRLKKIRWVLGLSIADMVNVLKISRADYMELEKGNLKLPTTSKRYRKVHKKIKTILTNATLSNSLEEGVLHTWLNQAMAEISLNSEECLNDNN